MEVRVLDVIVNLEPLEKPLLHVGRAERQAVADIVKQNALPLWKEAPDQESFQRNVADAGRILDGEEVKNVAVQHEEGIGAAVPAAGQFQRPALKGSRCR